MNTARDEKPDFLPLNILNVANTYTTENLTNPTTLVNSNTQKNSS